jgi:hypothetical protein
MKKALIVLGLLAVFFGSVSSVSLANIPSDEPCTYQQRPWLVNGIVIGWRWVCVR